MLGWVGGFEVGGVMESFDTVKIEKKEGLARFSKTAEETGSAQLF